MHMMEMVLALLATVLFTSLSLTYNQAIWAQTDYLNNATTVVQASQICHSELDKIDAELLAGRIGLEEIKNANGVVVLKGIKELHNTSTTLDLSHLSEKYNIHTEAVFCDKYGNTMEMVYDPDKDEYEPKPIESSLYVKMTVTVSGPNYLKHPYSMTRIFTETFVR